MGNNCSSCDWNVDGFCDRLGTLVEDDDQCNKWEPTQFSTHFKELTKCGKLSYHD